MEQEIKKLFMLILTEVYGEDKIPMEAMELLKNDRFKKPSLEEVKNYMLEYGTQNYIFEAEAFFNFYESKGWKVGKNKMKDWKAAVRNWSKDKRKKKLII